MYEYKSVQPMSGDIIIAIEKVHILKEVKVYSTEIFNSIYMLDLSAAETFPTLVSTEAVTVVWTSSCYHYTPLLLYWPPFYVILDQAICHPSSPSITLPGNCKLLGLG